MGKKKPLPPRRLRMKRAARLQSAKSWVGTYQGRCLIRGYRKWYGVDHACAIREFELLGVQLDPRRVDQKKSAIEKARQQTIENRKRKEKEEMVVPAIESNEYFSYIAGYTPAGFAYGLTWVRVSTFFDGTFFSVIDGKVGRVGKF